MAFNRFRRNTDAIYSHSTANISLLLLILVFRKFRSPQSSQPAKTYLHIMCVFFCSSSFRHSVLFSICQNIIDCRLIFVRGMALPGGSAVHSRQLERCFSAYLLVRNRTNIYIHVHHLGPFIILWRKKSLEMGRSIGLLRGHRFCGREAYPESCHKIQKEKCPDHV